MQPLGRLGSTSIEFAIFTTLCKHSAERTSCRGCVLGVERLPEPQRPAGRRAEPPKRAPVLPGLALLTLLHVGVDGY